VHVNKDGDNNNNRMQNTQTLLREVIGIY